MSVSVIIPAAGKGRRMGTTESKQFLPLAGEPVLIRTLRVFLTHSAVRKVILVVGEEDVERTRNLVKESGLQSDAVAVTVGGKERQESVYNGLKLADTEWVLVHDAVRPFITHERITALLEEVKMTGAAILAVPVKDTIKEVSDARVVDSTPDRSRLWAVQTPQAFRRTLLEQAHEQGRESGFTGTDDAMLVEELGVDVRVVEGDYTNLKLTTPEDLVLAEAIWKMRGTTDDDPSGTRV